ncbi:MULTISPECIES: hypothetical protein [Streptomyces]|uniref:hypothetical protein n=1 Tax=Streptomyces TaxID=1883 RepID=UPI00226F12D5|nr:hypothetical protein [Streptomyces sp. H27-H5]MCY0963301.1 hypothetical protein [Streptomyces sp. H27-H5]GLX41490.1 hypothetical protein Sros01_75630 [Streptomyces roseochromogenus]
MTRASEPDLQGWIEEGRRNIVDVADMLGVAPDIYTRDPMSLIPALQGYVSRAPLSEFEQSDWITLHSDLMSYVADYLIQKHGAQWKVADDPSVPRGYRYVIEATGRDGVTRRIDPADVVRKEFSNLPIEIPRMLASAELTLRLAAQFDGGE